jgi:hypothetical protein
VPRIEFLIDGPVVNIDAIGFSGPACEAETTEILAKLGGKPEIKRKSEFYSKGEQRQTTTRSR